MNEKEIQKYLRDIGKRLFFAENKDEIVLKTEKRIKDYILLNPDANIKDLIEEYGTPEEQVDNWIARTPKARDLIQKRKIVKILLAGIFAVVILVLLTVGLSLVDGWVSGSLDNPFTGETVGYAPVHTASRTLNSQ